MALSVRELITLEIKRRLEQITLANGYNFDIESVQRFRHQWDGSRHWVNEFSGRRSILILSGPESGGSGGADQIVDAWQKRAIFDIYFFVQGDNADDDQINLAIQDLEAALFKDAGGAGDPTFGYGAYNVSFQFAFLERQDEQPVEGVVCTLEFTYEVLIGSPDETT